MSRYVHGSGRDDAQLNNCPQGRFPKILGLGAAGFSPPTVQLVSRVATMAGQAAGAPYYLTGGLCENNDKFAIERSLPEIQIGDIVAIHDTGAHGFSMGYNYNGKLRSAEVLLKEDGSFQLIRRAETPEDYFATFDFSDFHFGK